MSSGFSFGRLKLAPGVDAYAEEIVEDTPPVQPVPSATTPNTQISLRHFHQWQNTIPQSIQRESYALMQKQGDKTRTVHDIEQINITMGALLKFLTPLLVQETQTKPLQVSTLKDLIHIEDTVEKELRNHAVAWGMALTRQISISEFEKKYNEDIVRYTKTQQDFFNINNNQIRSTIGRLVRLWNENIRVTTVQHGLDFNNSIFMFIVAKERQRRALLPVLTIVSTQTVVVGLQEMRNILRYENEHKATLIRRLLRLENAPLLRLENSPTPYTKTPNATQNGVKNFNNGNATAGDRNGNDRRTQPPKHKAIQDTKPPSPRSNPSTRPEYTKDGALRAVRNHEVPPDQPYFCG